MFNRHAIVVLPPGAFGNVRTTSHRRWLSRGLVAYEESGPEMLGRVASLLDAPEPGAGLASIRYWGHTGRRPPGWIVAADPVHLQTRMRDLVVHSLAAGQLAADELHDIFRSAQALLVESGDMHFEAIDTYGYLRGADEIGGAACSPALVSGSIPDESMPVGPDAGPYHRLMGELQMLLHDHAVNERRAAIGSPVINSIWLWGGGIAPEPVDFELPRLFADDVLFRGYWASCSQAAEAWPGNLATCVQSASEGFVAVTPDDDHGMLETWLDELRSLHRGGKLDNVTLLFRDNLGVKVRRGDLLRSFGGISPYLMEQADDA